MKRRAWIFLCLLVGIGILFGAVMLGSVPVSPAETGAVLAHKLLRQPLPESVEAITVSIVWSMRLPRVLLAFLAGGALALSGAVLQSVLRNPLASSYTIGVSSGACLGVSLMIAAGFVLPSTGNLGAAAVGILFGVGTVLLVILFSARIDRNLGNQTIILFGMVFSLFVNAIQSLVSYMDRENMQMIQTWQMGSFALRGWSHVGFLALLSLIIGGVLMLYHREMDVLTFGEEQAMSMGVNTRRVKWVLLLGAAGLTGVVVAFAGIIGFVDLVAPHIVRKLFGPSHRVLLPLSVLFGGSFMVLADLVARTVVSPSEMPVGVVTALIGAPFFAYVYLKGRRER